MNLPLGGSHDLEIVHLSSHPKQSPLAFFACNSFPVNLLTSQKLFPLLFLVPLTDACDSLAPVAQLRTDVGLDTDPIVDTGPPVCTVSDPNFLRTHQIPPKPYRLVFLFYSYCHFHSLLQAKRPKQPHFSPDFFFEPIQELSHQHFFKKFL